MLSNMHYFVNESPLSEHGWAKVHVPRVNGTEAHKEYDTFRAYE